GDEYVDYVGISSYMFSQAYSDSEKAAKLDVLGTNSKTQRWSQQIDFFYNIYGYKKPVIISEGGASYIDGNTRGEITDYAAYHIRDFYTYLPIRYPNMKYAVYFNIDKDDREKYVLSDRDALINAYNTAIKDEYFITEPSQSANIPYYYAPLETLSESNPIRADKEVLCSYIKYVKDAEVRQVRYLVSGINVGSSREIPYEVECDFSEFAGEEVIVTVQALDIQGNVLVTKDFAVKVEGDCPRFSDVKSTAWYAHYVHSLARKNILNGKGNGLFDPDGKITRAEFAKILAVASGDDLSQYAGKTSFGDVAADSWFSSFVEWAYQNGIVNGKGNGYAPNDNISRQEMAVMIARYAGYKGVTLPQINDKITFNDDGDIAGWAKEAVEAMQQAGIINGKPGNIFDPKGNATRAEASKMISIFLTLA
ncbi:MAG: S-layer homology domain-containing protein, partial [Bacillota bacterium]|nr:S-layer homology domain-containing protein [Bacillota bacterium]